MRAHISAWIEYNWVTFSTVTKMTSNIFNSIASFEIEQLLTTRVTEICLHLVKKLLDKRAQRVDA